MLVQNSNTFNFVQNVNVNWVKVPRNELPPLQIIPDPAVRPSLTRWHFDVDLPY